jgi:hypothetical protein
VKAAPAAGTSESIQAHDAGVDERLWQAFDEDDKAGTN